MEEWISQLYKSKGGFGKKTIENRRNSAVENRRDHRNSVLTRLRQIPQVMSPLQNNIEEPPKEKPEVKKSKRLELLEKWKKEKENRKLEIKKRQKPIFKVCRVEASANLYEAFHFIKGKKIIRGISPLPNHNENVAGCSKSTSSRPVLKNESVDKTLQIKGALKKNNLKINSKSTKPSTILHEPTSRAHNIPERPCENLQGTSKQRNVSRKAKDDSNYRTVISVIAEEMDHISLNTKLTKKSSTSNEPSTSFSGSLNRKINNQSEMEKYKSSRVFHQELMFHDSKNISRAHHIPEKISTARDDSNYRTVIAGKKDNISLNTKLTKTSTSNEPSTSFSGSLNRKTSNQSEMEKYKSSRVFHQEPMFHDSKNTSRAHHIPEKISTAIDDSSVGEPSSSFSDGSNRTTINQSEMEKRKSFRVSLEESILHDSENRADESSRTMCDNDYTLQIESVATPTVGSKNNSLRISLQKNNVDKIIASANKPSDANSSKNFLDDSGRDLDEREIRKNKRRKIRNNTEYLSQCYVPLTPLSANRCLMESTPFPSEKNINTRSSTKTSRITPKNRRDTFAKEFTLSSPNRKDINSSKLIREKRSTSKKNALLPNCRKDSPKAITVISTPNGEMFVSNNEDLRNSSKSPKNLSNVSGAKMDSSRHQAILNNDLAASKSGEITGSSGNGNESSSRANSVRRSSRRIVVDPLKENEYERSKNQPTVPKISRKNITNTPKAEWNLRINDTYKNETPNNSSAKRNMRKSKSVNTYFSPDEEFLTPNKYASIEDVSDNVFKTPNPEKDNEVVHYVSPFVTTSRGKSAARKEYIMRKSLDGLNTSIAGSTDPKSPKAAAAYFERILSREIARIQELCDVWQNYKESGNVSDDACGLIDMTIGQSNLLLTKKFSQFRGLIEKCRNNDQTEMKIQCEDLHGFWDMIFKQVQDLEKRFENLEDMKRNNWLEDVPKKKTPRKTATKPKKKKARKAKSVTEGSSLLRETIQAARRKKAMRPSNSEGDLSVLILKKNTPNRKILANSSVSKVATDPSTPNKGILKSTNSKSEKKKNVAFKEMRTSTAEKENKLTSTFSRKDTPVPTRRSERLSLGRSKLSFDD